ncbi:MULTISPECIES: GTP cyclohydrolase II [unclassified Planococcus (in: firmicutes)]|uniref:GTP cyclohydrolase II n=1 Tax=unclassified Planococcus (in: firmicutes) TaxID=2662419 RepID=UPI000C7CD432|nr:MULTISPECIES: GTP cyclohydrolase II [unclassified Planococcus (in: firmicutes)]PKG48912.1 GTP cyclohydrolase [Planococcus sp. Urea-trap-24]PKG89687.1 GTP cyclohydrolase [Planococcus sp. Urea-3u-39]
MEKLEEKISDNNLQMLENFLEILPLKNKEFLYLYGPTSFPTYKNSKREVYDWYVWTTSKKFISKKEFINNIYKEEMINKNYNSALLYGDFSTSTAPLVRVHSCCFTGDVFQSGRCDCGPQLDASIEKIIENGSGAIIYMANHEGRGIGLLAKAMANKIQDLGVDTYKSNRILGFEEDLRDFSDAAQVINYLRKNESVTLLSNNPFKIESLKKNGLKISDIESINGNINIDNINYLNDKKLLGNHLE